MLGTRLCYDDEGDLEAEIMIDEEEFQDRLSAEPFLPFFIEWGPQTSLPGKMHVTHRVGAAELATVHLVGSVTVSGQDYVTQVDDDQGQFLLASGTDHQTITFGERVFGRPIPGRRSWPHAG